MTATATVSAACSKPGRLDGTYRAVIVDEATRQTVQAVGVQLGWTRFGIHEGGAETAISLIANEAALDLLIVDISDSREPLASMAAIAEVCRAETKVVAVGILNDIDFYRRLIEMGVSDYLVKPITREGFSGALRKATRSEADDTATAKSVRRVAMIGSRGGVGVTTLAVSVAWAISQRQTVVVLDLDLQFGNVGLSLDLTTGRGLRELLTSPERLDRLLVESAMTKAGERLRILGGEEPLEGVLNVAPIGLAALFTEITPSTDYIIIDTPRRLDSATREVLEIADVVAVVTDQSLAGMRDTDRLLRLINGMGGQGRAVVIGNRLGGVPGEVGRADFERGIEAKLSASIPLDMKAAVTAAQLGKAFGAVATAPKTVAELQALALALGAAATPTASPTFMTRMRRK